MNLSILGYGKMGRMVEAAAQKRGHRIRAIIDPTAKDATARAISANALSDTDVCIDFSTPAACVANIRATTALGKDLVVGTTGWYDQLDTVRALVEKQGTGFVYSSNFSVGMNLFFRMVENAAKAMDKFAEYDVAGIEQHHHQKQDSPSGSARTLSEILQKNIARKKKTEFGMLDRAIAPDELHFVSVRCGSIHGTHTILFDSPVDSIELTHTARSREGFASGAVLAAEWIHHKKGFFTMDDVMKGMLG